MSLPADIYVEVPDEVLLDIEREIESDAVPEDSTGEWVESAIRQRLQRGRAPVPDGGRRKCVGCGSEADGSEIDGACEFTEQMIPNLQKAIDHPDMTSELAEIDEQIEILVRRS